MQSYNYSNDSVVYSNEYDASDEYYDEHYVDIYYDGECSNSECSDEETSEDIANEGGYKYNVNEFCDLYDTLRSYIYNSDSELVQLIADDMNMISYDDFNYKEASNELQSIKEQISKLVKANTEIPLLIERCEDTLDVIQEYL